MYHTLLENKYKLKPMIMKNKDESLDLTRSYNEERIQERDL